MPRSTVDAATTHASDEPAAWDAPTLRARAAGLSQLYRDELAILVGIDSGSWNRAGVDAVGDWCAARMAGLGFTVERLPTAPVEGRSLGGVVVARRAGAGTRRIVLLAHLDTVFEDGTAARRPYRESDGRAYGPGVSDDKGGALAGIHAAQILIESGFEGFGELLVIFTPDEEIGSPASGHILRALVATADAALCLECARENGDIVTARKGMADVRIDIRGRAAHSGVEPHRGINAAVEAAEMLLDVHGISSGRPGVDVNIGVVRAGERPNVVPASAQLIGEVRAARLADLEFALDAIDERAARPTVAGAIVTAERMAVCPPLERSSRGDALFALAVEAGRDLGLEVRGAATGGVSDANFVAAEGVAVLDGLGPIGGDDHSENEWLDLATVPDRVALLAVLIVRIAAG